MVSPLIVPAAEVGEFVDYETLYEAPGQVHRPTDPTHTVCVPMCAPCKGNRASHLIVCRLCEQERHSRTRVLPVVDVRWGACSGIRLQTQQQSSVSLPL
jgi:hypothetical protein